MLHERTVGPHCSGRSDFPGSRMTFSLISKAAWIGDGDHCNYAEGFSTIFIGMKDGGIG